MGRREETGRSEKRLGMSFFKLIISIAFLLISLLYTLYIVSLLGLYSNGWEWAQSLPGVSSLNDWLNSFVMQSANGKIKTIGVYSFFIGIDVVLVYTSVFYFIQKIPFIGKMLKWITGIIPGLGVLAIIIGAVLIWVI